MLKLLGVGAATGLAGCTNNGGDSSNSSSSSGSDGSSTSSNSHSSTPTAKPENANREVKGTYKSAVSVDAQSLNWLTIDDNTSGSFILLALDGTWAIDDKQEIFPLWAEPSTDDGRVYSIKLRENLKWGGDYGQMTAEDWVYMIKNVFQSDENWSGTPYYGRWHRAPEGSDETKPIPVEKTGKYSFDIKLPEIDPSFPFKPVMWGMNAMPKDLLKQYVDKQDADGLKKDKEVQTLKYAGNLGPYTYDNWKRQSQFSVKRNENYYMTEVDGVGDEWKNAPYFEGYVYKIIKEQSSRLGALKSGDIDDAGIPPNKAKSFKQNKNINVTVQPQPYVTVLAYNMRKNGWEPFQKKEVRQALGYAVNKKSLVDGIYRGYAEVAQTMQPSFSKWYNNSKITNYGVGDNYGKEKTHSKLESALKGTDYSFDGDTLKDGNGEQVQLSLYYDQGQDTEKTMAEFIAQEFGNNAGIKVNLQATSSFIQKYASNSPPDGKDVPWSAGMFNGGPRDVSVSQRDWDMSVNLAFNTYPYTPASSKDFFEEKGDINYYGYVPDKDIASIYEQASKTKDEKKRKQLFGKAFGYINDEQPFGFMAMTSDILGTQKKVVGPTSNFASGWNYQTYYFK